MIFSLREVPFAQLFICAAFIFFCSFTHAWAYSYSQSSYSSYSYGQSSYYSQGSYSSYSYGQSSYYSQSSYSSYSYSQSSYSSYSQGSYSSGYSYTQGSYSSGYSYTQSSYSSGGGYSSGNITPQTSDCFLCDVYNGTMATAQSVVDMAKGLLGIETDVPSYTTLPENTTIKKPVSGSTYADIPVIPKTPMAPIPDSIQQQFQRQEEIKIQTEVYTSAEMTVRNLAQAEGWDINSPAIEGALFLALEASGNNPSAAIQKLKAIEESTGADLDAAIKNNVALLNNTGCTDRECQAATELGAQLGISQNTLMDKMQDVDDRIKLAEQNADPIGDGVTWEDFQDFVSEEEEEELLENTVIYYDRGLSVAVANQKIKEQLQEQGLEYEVKRVGLYDEEIIVAVPTTVPGTAPTLSEEDRQKLEIAQKSGLDVSDPTKAAAALKLGEGRTAAEYQELLTNLDNVGDGTDILNRLVNDLATGQNTVNGEGLKIELAKNLQGINIPHGTGGLTLYLRQEIEKAKDPEDAGKSIEELLQETTEEYLIARDGTPETTTVAQVNFDMLSSKEKAELLGLSEESVRKIQEIETNGFTTTVQTPATPQESPSSCFFCVEKVVNTIGVDTIKYFIDQLPGSNTALEALERFTNEACDATCTNNAGLRRNNPTNIEDSGDAWVGRLADDGERFVEFSTPEYGFRAAFILQQTYQNKHNLWTIADRVGRFTPGVDTPTGEVHDIPAKVAAIAAEMGIDPNTPFNITDPVLGPAFIKALTHTETGAQYADVQVVDGYALAFEKKVGGETVQAAYTEMDINTGNSGVKEKLYDWVNQFAEEPADTVDVDSYDEDHITDGTVQVNSMALLTDETVRVALAEADITVVESRPGATDLNGLRAGTLDEILDLQEKCGCEITITGGTEDGPHADGEFSHENGFKFDARTIDPATGNPNDLANFVTSNFELKRTRGDGAQVYVDPDKPNVEYALEGNHLDVLVISDDTIIVDTETSDTIKTSIDESPVSTPTNNPTTPVIPTYDNRTPVAPQAPGLVETTVNCLSNFFSCVSQVFTGGTGKTPTIPSDSLIDSDDDDDSSDNTPSTPEVEDTPTDLTAEATTATAGAFEYRFRGFIIRTLTEASDVEDLQANFSRTLQNKLLLDYSCDGTIDAQKTFTIPYRSFTFDENESSVLISEYLPVTKTGSHCFSFEIDTSKAVQEQNERNNTSNRQSFTVETL